MLALAVVGAVVPQLFHSAFPAAAPADTATTAPPGSAVVVSSGSVTASITLPTTTVRAGGTVSGTITVENDSGKPIHLLGCGSVYAVLLVRADYRHSPSWPLCAQEITIPTGESSYPVAVTATYQECSPQGTKGIRECDRDGSLPPLPAGRYEATTTAVGPGLPVPAAVSVTVTP